MEILIADDHAVVRRGLKEILIEAFAEARFAEAPTGDDVLRALGGKRFDLLMLDLTMPGRSGLDLLQEVRRTHPKLPVIVLTVHSEEQYAFRCLRAGASAFLSKESIIDELALAVKKVMSGGRYVSAELAGKLIGQIDRSEVGPPHQQLSDREHEILKMLARGMSLTEIAERLRISAKTVTSYRARILEKMGMQTNAELTRYALKANLID